MNIEIFVVDDESVVIKLHWAGEAFYDIKNLLVMGGFSFHPEFETDDQTFFKVWVGTKNEGYSILPELEFLSGLRFGKELRESLAPVPETKFVRNSFDPNLIVGTPLGDFQIQGIRRGISQSRFYLAWEMRLGKTYVTVGILNHRMHYGEIDRVLFILPPEALYTFLDDFWLFQKMGATKENVYVADVFNRNPFQPHVKFAFMTYNTFRMLSDDAYKAAHKGRKSKAYRKPPLPIENWGTSRAIVLDEAHVMRNRTARITHVLFLHRKFFEYRYLLSGTPSPNRIEQFYSQLKFLDQAIIPESYMLWIRKIADVGSTFSATAINRYYPDKVEEFYDSVKGWVSREFTKGNLPTPEAIVKTIWCHLSKTQQEIYQAIVDSKLMVLKEKEGRLVPRKVRDKFTYFMQALEDPCRIEVDSELNPRLAQLLKKWQFEDNCKIEACDSLLERFIREEDRKVIIWSGHPKTMNALAERYKAFHPIVVHGDLEMEKNVTKTAQRAQLVKEFKTSKKSRLLIASYLTTSASVNLMEATRMIYFDRSWDLIYWLQSKKRSDNHKNTEPVQIYPLVVKDSLDAYQNALLDQRKDLNDNMFNLDALSPETWKALFTGDTKIDDPFFQGERA